MQAFLYRHLVPADELLATIRPVKWKAPLVEVASAVPVQVPAGTAAEVTLKMPKRPIRDQLRLSLYQPPAGITLDNVRVVENGLAFDVKADADANLDGYKGNLIIEVYREYTPKGKEGKSRKPGGPQRRDWFGVVPAIPIQVVGKP
jgi:hypothetical protein